MFVVKIDIDISYLVSRLIFRQYSDDIQEITIAKKQKQVVRIVLPDGMNKLTPELSQLIECLRYAGIVTIHREDEEGLCFDLHCPNGSNDGAWAKMNAERMCSFAYNAVVAPGTSHL